MSNKLANLLDIIANIMYYLMAILYKIAIFDS